MSRESAHTGRTDDREKDAPGDGRRLWSGRRQHLLRPAAPGRHGPPLRCSRSPHGADLHALAGRLRHGNAPFLALGRPLGATVVHPGDARGGDRGPAWGRRRPELRLAGRRQLGGRGHHDDAATARPVRRPPGRARRTGPGGGDRHERSPHRHPGGPDCQRRGGRLPRMANDVRDRRRRDGCSCRVIEGTAAKVAARGLGGDVLRAPPVDRRAAAGRAGAASVVPSRGDELRGLQRLLVGLFGLAGIVGALAAPLAGRFADRRSPRWTIGAGLACILLSYAVLYEFGGTVCGMVVGVILLDLGAQSAHVSNQSQIYAIRPEARSRMNTAYMVANHVEGEVTVLKLRPAGTVVRKGEMVVEYDSEHLRDALTRQEMSVESLDAAYRAAVMKREAAEIGVREFVDGISKEDLARAVLMFTIARCYTSRGAE